MLALVALASAGALVLGGCVASPVAHPADTSPRGGITPSAPPSVLPTTPGDVSAEASRYHTETLVQSVPGVHPPLLCFGSEELCGFGIEGGAITDMPITNWDWGAVEGEEEVGGRIQGRYYLIGRYDGDAFTVERVAPPEESPWHSDGPPDKVPLHCAGVGWRPKTLGLMLTGEDRICLAAHEYRRRELSEIQGRVHRLIERRGHTVIWRHANDFLKRIEIGLLTPDPALERLVDRRWGRGVVRWSAALHPYDPPR